ncbi:putative lipoprotein [Mobilicoccus pelagius NBRC 104925]|uniref:Putative lipoprotein n=2 Tax=Mobilicoccus TaxID=984996 RepID=H5URT3_9MICO|nr:putative lipoprotein [Mobilicoccus pelagius NBRC 104925]
MLVPLLLAGALTAVITSWATDMRPMGLSDAFTFTLLLVAAAASAGLRFDRSEERVSFSFTAVVLLAAIPLVGPLGAVLLGIGAAVLDARQGWWQAWVFNGLMFGLSAAVASSVYKLAHGAVMIEGVLTVDGRPLLLGEEPAGVLTASVGVPLLLADAAFLATNLVVLLTVTPRDPTTPSRLALVGGMLRTVPTFLAWALVAFVVVVLWGPGGLDAIALLLVTAPLVLTRHMHGLFSAERRTRTGLIRAIAGAGRDDGVRAHDERVVRYADALALEMGLRPADRAAVHDAARLHTVGMSGPCTAAHRVGERRDLAVASAVAADQVLGRIDFLADAARAVRLEGEWFDGTGGPDGLRADAIPVHARILAVADAADVLVTTSDASRADAELVRRLRSMAGRRFDPAGVAALAAVLDVAEDVDEFDGPPEPGAGASAGAGDAGVPQHHGGDDSAAAGAGAPVARTLPAGRTTRPIRGARASRGSGLREGTVGGRRR